MSQSNRTIRIGTRGSSLALAQAYLVMEQIHQHFPEITCETVIIQTLGDKILDKPLLEFGGKGAFVTEFEDAILRNEIDIAVHSSKDMPMELGAGLEVVGVLKREDPRDVLVTKKGTVLDLMKSPVIGTSSLRRQYQIEQLLPHIDCSQLRGNVNTRLRKLSEGLYDGIILAAAGLKRLSLTQDPEFDYRYFSYDEMIPAAGQGIIAMEGRANSQFQEIFEKITDRTAMLELELERRALRLLEAGCHEPIGIFSEVIEDYVTIRMMKAVTSNLNSTQLEGKHKVPSKVHMITYTESSLVEQSMELVERMVNKVLEEC